MVRHEGSGQMKLFPVNEHDDALLNAGQPDDVNAPPRVVPITNSVVILVHRDSASDRLPVNWQMPELP